jgi:hypothetical protein
VDLPGGKPRDVEATAILIGNGKEAMRRDDVGSLPESGVYRALRDAEGFSDLLRR